ncbi:TetR/AcrR family transcriptional regulator [Paraeggerthella hominis]|uniref:TetR/AcrR family transcriptional regulator n=1 Tax=Paraeggerthella hominis TaxID=2897351 RepID=UPI003D0D6041
MPMQSSAPMPGVDPHLPRPVTRQVRESARLDGTAGDIMLAARELYERAGVAATSLASIAREAGVSRSLVYYYFPDKQAVTAAVLDDYLEDLIESVATWNELRAFGDTPSELKKCVSAFRRALYTASGRPRPMITVLEELGMRDKFATRAVREIVACIHRYIVSEYATYRTVDIQLVPETFGLLLFGLEGMMKAKPDITDDELALLIAQTLHLDMRVMDPPPWPEHPAASE